jgi:hypothetical protein
VAEQAHADAEQEEDASAADDAGVDLGRGAAHFT